MKIKEISRKLDLNKTTIAHLDDARMKKINAGFAVKISGESVCACNYTSVITDPPC